MAQIIKTLSFQGAQAKVVEVETNFRSGLNKFTIVGLPDRTIAEAKERITCALINQKLRYPYGKIIVNLLPAHYFKNGTYFDLAIALSIICATQSVKITPKLDLEKTVMIGELALDGRVRSTPIIPALIAEAVKLGFENIIVPFEDKMAKEIGKTYNNAKLLPVVDLNAAYQVIKTGQFEYKLGNDPRPSAPIDSSFAPLGNNQIGQLGLEVLLSNPLDLRVLKISAAGRHNLLLDGVPGSGKTLLANSLKLLLPKLSEKEAIEVMSIRSLSGISNNSFQTEPPFRVPHHTSSEIAILGGGRPPQPGEISLAHHGVLFLDEIAEFPHSLLESLRQPMIDKQINISRNTYKVTFPADFQLICTRNACPCGWYGSENKKCHCSYAEIKRYQGKVSGALLDRIDIKYRVEPNTYATHPEGNIVSKTTTFSLAEIRKQINTCRHILTNLNIADNSLANLNPKAQNLVKLMVNSRKLSWRSLSKVIKLARTIAVLDCATENYSITEDNLNEAIYLNSPAWSMK